MTCSRPACSRRVYAFGLCHSHHQHAATTGALLVGRVSPDLARRHLNWLIEQGMSQAEVERVAGLSWKATQGIKTGASIMRSTEAKLLAVQPLLKLRVVGESKVPALGTARRLQALAAMGYTNRFMAGRLGVTETAVWRVMCRSERCEVYVAKAAAVLFDELWDKPGPSVRARRRAARKRWVSALGWDCIDTDLQPNRGVVVPVSFPERYAELREHVGLTPADVAQRLGIQLESLDRQLARHGVAS